VLFSFYDKYSIRSEIGAYTENNGFSPGISLDRTIKQRNILNISPTKLHLDSKEMCFVELQRRSTLAANVICVTK
jgi:hypothetical protein